MTSAGEDVEELEHSHIVGRNVQRHSHFGEQSGCPSESYTWSDRMARQFHSEE